MIQGARYTTRADGQRRTSVEMGRIRKGDVYQGGEGLSRLDSLSRTSPAHYGLINVHGIRRFPLPPGLSGGES